MKAFLLPLAVLASSALAQTSSACGADYIVDTCLGDEKAKLAACAGTDYDCQCAGWQNILVCYNNCPNDTRQFSDAGQRDIFCAYASQFSSSEPTPAPSKASSSAAPAKQTQNADVEDQGASASAGSGPASTTHGSGPASTNNAAYLAFNAGGVLAAVAGAVAVLL
ncbi:hypothetical protein C8A00DRAFT_14690 [Chaetomidium leptoderma]|uniref:GPI anchored serine-threonine rich protein n=1 Tax=Chaetomidium leptoderma TaxID=669021 RepID=A0AAN6ZW45_9PEZI|nr:hypothetical protein C8A00DRAFT_14690 [Chaetomidium leptoderma]